MCIKILIANNSLSAYKFIYSIRKSKILCDFYGIATEETLNQAYIKFLKNFIILPSGDASTNFGNIDCVITAAKKFKVDYVYPGWGYLSENSDFAKALSENNIKFIGPSHEAMYMLGNKLIATKIASDLGVPVIPYAMLERSTDVSHLNLEYDDVAKILENENEIKAIFGNKKIAMFKLLSNGQKRKLLKDITFEKLCKHIPNKNYSLNVEKLKNIWTKYSALSADRNNKGQALEQDEAVVNFGTLYGYPLILKSASTGGGRGIYKINNIDEFRETVNSLSCDVKKEMMVCKLINNASHIELQMCADAFGNIKCIGGRDCTLQRKNQKMIEESLVIDQDAYAKLTEYSIKLLQKGKYVGVATVEFLLSEGKFYFLEINTRIQVEHPITEITSKTNIPELQLRIAMNENISNIRIKSFARHVIGCRIVAEDPWNNFLPTAGEFQIETQFEKKVFGYYNTLHGSINKNGDSQFGHIFAEGKNRKSCIRKLIKHLKSTFIDGLVTNKDFVIEVLSSKVFAKQRYHTKTLEEVIERYQQTGVKNVDCKVLEDKKHKIDFNNDRDSPAANEHKSIDAKSAITGPDIFAIVYALDKGQNFVELNFTDYKYQYNYQTYVVSNNQIILITNSSYCTFTYFVDKHDYYIFANDCYTKANLDHNLGSYAVKSDSNTYKFSTDHCQSNLIAPTDGVIVNMYKDQNTNIQCKEKYAEIEIMKTRISLFSETSGLINYKKAVGDVVRKGDLIAYIHVESTVSIPSSARSFQNEIMVQKPNRANFANSQFDFSILKSVFQGYELPTEFYEIFSNQDISDINTCVDILKMYYKCKVPNENQIKVIKLVLHKLIAIFGVDIERQLNMSLLEVLEVLDSIIIEMNYDDEIYNSLLKIRQYFSEYKFKYMNMWYNKNASEKQFTDYLSRHCSYKEGLLFALSYLEQDPNLLLTKYLCNITGKSPKEIRLTFDGNKCCFTYQNMECVFLMCGTSCQKKDNHGIVIHYNCKEDEVKNHFYIVTADETPFVTYKYNQYASTVDIITEKLKNLDVDKNEGLVYKDIFRNLCIYDKRSHLDVIYKIDTHSGNSVMDVKNLSHAIKQILCAIKITSKKTKISESHFKITVEGKIKVKDEQIFSIVEGCIFYYAKSYCKHGVTSLIVIYENEQMHKIHLMINRGVMEKYFYTNKELHKYIIDDYEIFDAKTSDPESVVKIKEVIQNEGKEKNSNFLLRNSTISVDSFLYLIKIFFAKTNQNVSIDETYLGILEQSEPIANSFYYNQKQYILTDKCSKIGIRAFYIKFSGKSVILLMNDILHKNGSFSIDEDIFYTLMVRNARSKNVPFVFVSCNSGARIGIYDNIKDHLKINNSEFYTEQKDGVFVENGKIISVFGNDDSGSENLAFSGLVAKETSEAYDSIFYLSYVTGRSVGIGAYANKLGQRIIQKQGSSILLTGYQALNKVLKAKVFSNNEQIGGTQIMCKNGNTHLEVTSEYEAVVEIMRWLDFYYTRSKNTNNLDHAIYPSLSKDQKIEKYLKLYHSSAFLERFTEREILEYVCDANTLKEYKRHFGTNVILARAKINDVSLGIIAPESNDYVDGHKITKNVLDPESTEKIAQGIADFSNEGLDIFLIANFKGFTGGQEEMSKNILKYGSQIVENLKKCKTKIIMYVPCEGEVRGGSWVVFDKFMNKNITIIAHPNSEVGIIEADAMADLKFKETECKRLFALNNLLYNDKEGKILRKKFCALHDSVYRMYLTCMVDDLVTTEHLKEAIARLLK